MANVCMLLGKSGTGKSTSIKSLDPKSTVVINTLKKRLPFKGSSSMYNTESKNLFQKDNYIDIISLLNNIDKNGTHVKNIIIDDMIYTMRKEYYASASKTGYGKFVEMAQHFQQIVSTCENMRDDLNVFFVLHSEDVVNDKAITGYKVATIGRMIDDSYNPIEVVPIVLYSAVKYDDKGVPQYGFYTHRCMEGSVEIPAKSPDGMFTEDFIPNDLAFVVKTMQEYYN